VPGAPLRTRRVGRECVALPGEPGCGFFRISFSCLRILFSRRSRLSSSRSALESPSLRRPSSRSACVSQLRMVWAEGSNSLASSSGVRPARTSSMICRRNSGGYGGRDFGIVDSFLPKDRVSTKPGQLHPQDRTRCRECCRKGSTIGRTWRQPKRIGIGYRISIRTKDRIFHFFLRRTRLLPAPQQQLGE